MTSEKAREEIMRSVAFTGYRPQKLPFGNNLTHPEAVKLRSALYNEFERLIIRGFKYFYTGGALGGDLMAAEVILELFQRYGHRELCHYLCLPCRNHCAKWRSEDIVRFERIRAQSKIILVSDSNYFNGCMQIRNQYMVDRSAVLIALFDGQNGGTKNTVDYARKMQRKIVMLRPRESMRMEFFEKPEDVEQLTFTDSENDGSEQRQAAE